MSHVSVHMPSSVETWSFLCRAMFERVSRVFSRTLVFVCLLIMCHAVTVIEPSFEMKFWESERRPRNRKLKIPGRPVLLVGCVLELPPALLVFWMFWRPGTIKLMVGWHVEVLDGDGKAPSPGCCVVIDDGLGGLSSDSNPFGGNWEQPAYISSDWPLRNGQALSEKER